MQLHQGLVNLAGEMAVLMLAWLAVAVPEAILVKVVTRCNTALAIQEAVAVAVRVADTQVVVIALAAVVAGWAYWAKVVMARGDLILADPVVAAVAVLMGKPELVLPATAALMGVAQVITAATGVMAQYVLSGPAQHAAFHQLVQEICNA
jgi:hypothetical protein